MARAPGRLLLLFASNSRRTILEAAGTPGPKTVDGIAQEPIDGTSFLYTFADQQPRGAAHAPALRPDPRPLQAGLASCAPRCPLPDERAVRALGRSHLVRAPFGHDAVD
jgi:hypothetical protein